MVNKATQILVYKIILEQLASHTLYEDVADMKDEGRHEDEADMELIHFTVHAFGTGASHIIALSFDTDV